MKSILEVNKVSKSFQLATDLVRHQTLREYVQSQAAIPLRFFQRKDGANPRAKQLFWALQDINFEVGQGEVLGIIGRNGAGKSTLLKIISRISRPTKGVVVSRGRLASLLEVGTGFHPELTGRENIFLNGAILGMRKTEIESKFDEIVAFAEVEGFLATPVKHYSSGMYVRLAFAVAAHLNPEILIVDEVLAVGDAAFQQKCLGKMREASSGGRTVLFVSHNLAAIESFCQRGVVIEHGKIHFEGTAQKAVEVYNHMLFGGLNSRGHVFDLTGIKRRSKIGPFLKRIELYTDGDTPAHPGVSLGSSLEVRVFFDCPMASDRLDMGLGFNDNMQRRVFTAHTWFSRNTQANKRETEQVFVCRIPSFTLMPGEYSLRVWLDVAGSEADLVDDAALLKVIEADYYGTGRRPWNGVFVLEHHWRLEAANRYVANIAK